MLGDALTRNEDTEAVTGLYGGPGRDTLRGGPGKDRMDGGRGCDPERPLELT